MATLHYTEYVYIAQTHTQIPTPYFCMGQDSESESVPESVSGNIYEPSVKLKENFEEQEMLFSIVLRFGNAWFLLCLEWLDVDWLNG